MVTRCSLPPAVVVVGAAALLNFLYSGVFYCSGLFFYDFLHTFDGSRQATALTLSLMGASLYTSGLFSGPLIMQFGARAVAVVGALLSSAGLTLSAFAPSLGMLYATFGLLTGCTQGFLMTAGVVCVQQHTSRRRALASGIAYTGSAVGGLIFPLIFRWGQSVYGWRGTLLLLAGLHFHTVPAAMLLLPPPPPAPHDDLDKAEGRPERQALTEGAPGGDDHTQHTPGPGSVGSCRQELSLWSRLVSKVRRARVVVAGGGLPALACVLMYVFRIVGTSAVHTFLPMKVASLGLAPGRAAHLVSGMSVGELVGRLVTTPTVCLHDRLPLVYLVLGALSHGVLQAVLGATTTLSAVVGATAAVGFASGAVTCCASTVVRDTVGLQHLPWVLGLCYATAGLGHFAAVQILALVWEKTDNVSLVFLICGLSMALAGLTMAINKIVHIWKGKRSSGIPNPGTEISVT